MQVTHFFSRYLLFSVLIAAFSQAHANNIERVNWKKQLAVKKIEVNNQLGDIRLRFGGYNSELEVIAMVQHNESVGVIEIKEAIDGDVYQLSLVRVDPETKQTMALIQDDKARVDFTLFVPKGIVTHAQTKSGLVESRKMVEPVYLQSESGDVFLRDNKNIVKATTRSGKITANLLEIESNEAQTFNTVTGMIDIWIGDKYKQNVHIETSGELTTDFSLEVDRDMNKEPNKKATAVINGGGSVIKASSKRGPIALRAFPQL